MFSVGEIVIDNKTGGMGSNHALQTSLKIIQNNLNKSGSGSSNL